MYYRSGTERCCIGAGQTFRVHSPGCSTFPREMISVAVIAPQNWGAVLHRPRV